MGDTQRARRRTIAYARDMAEPRVGPWARFYGPQRSAPTTAAELTDAAIAMRPQLFMRAFELTKHRADAEDLLHDTYLRFIERPPEPRSATQLKHWLRTVMLRRHVDAHRRQVDELQA